LGSPADAIAVRPLGVIVDTNSAGRFDLVLYEDGILAVRGTYMGVALRAGGIGMVGGGPAAAGGGAATGNLAGRGHEGARLSNLLQEPRSAVLRDHASNHFIPVDSVLRVALKNRWHEHSLTISTREHPDGRKYVWKPALNDFKRARTMLEAKFGALLVVDTGFQVRQLRRER